MLLFTFGMKTYEVLCDGSGLCQPHRGLFPIAARQAPGLLAQSFAVTMYSFLLMVLLWSHCVLSFTLLCS